MFTKPRKHRRIEDRLRVQLLTPRFKEVYAEVVSKDFGQGGCKLLSNFPIGVGKIFPLKMFLDNIPCLVVGKALYAFVDPDKPGNYYTGVQFIDAGENNLDLLKSYIELFPFENEGNTSWTDVKVPSAKVKEQLKGVKELAESRKVKKQVVNGKDGSNISFQINISPTSSERSINIAIGNGEDNNGGGKDVDISISYSGEDHVEKKENVVINVDGLDQMKTFEKVQYLHALHEAGVLTDELKAIISKKILADDISPPD
ncbi:MAG: hypothetical protein C0609_04875 [Deltaproteobacteria bacterium]|nr:MAG: hypothetical protein C0609_04875 [Deltaproteobacteria bacterium]